MTLSLYSPRVLAYARMWGCTDLEARTALIKSEAAHDQFRARRRDFETARALLDEAEVIQVQISSPTFLERIFGISPDWNKY